MLHKNCRTLRRAVARAALPLFLGATVAEAQTGRLAGTITEQQSGAGLAAASIIVRGTRLGAVSQDNGRYVVNGITPGTYTIEVRRVGYTADIRAGMVIGTDETKLDVALSPTAIRLSDMVVTGVTDPIAAEKLPFSVGKISRDEMPIPVVTTSAILQGKVAGVTIVKGDGQPGSGSSVMLRSPTAITKSNSPLYVVDGVVLGSTFSGTTVDLDALDIESVEVVKGAAAASLYGSRAASGVIQIKTVSGKRLAEGRTQVTLRSEYGYNQLGKELSLNTHHWFRQDATGNYLDASGKVTTSTATAAAAADRISDKVFPTPVYNNLRAFFNPGGTRLNSVSVAQNGGRSNWFASFNRTQDGGVVKTLTGYHRNDFRANIDNTIRDNLTSSIRVSHSRSYSDDESGSPFQDLIYMMPNIDLSARDSLGNYIAHPDLLVGIDNPIWRQGSRDNWTKRGRTLASADFVFTPWSWFRATGTYGYDHSEIFDNSYVPKGVENSDGSPATGSVAKNQRFTDVVNANLQGAVNHQFGDLNARLTVGGSLENEHTLADGSTGTFLFVQDVPSQSIARDKTLTSSEQTIKSNGMFSALAFDYASKYIVDFNLRRDGSSLFGPREQYHLYNRAAFAYRIGQESWFPFRDVLSETKLHYAVGTAGGRPAFADQYETFTVSSVGAVTKGTLGNPDLRPMFSVEREAGLDFTIKNRVSAELVYAHSRTTDQIISVPAPATSGYTSQNVNAGTIEGNSLEMTIRADLVRRKSWNWSSMLTADRSTNKIVAWGRNCIFDGDNLGMYCPGATRGDMYGYHFLRGLGELPAVHANSASQFAINDDGYLVPVGPNATWKDVGKFGTTVTIDGVAYNWGLPFTQRNASGSDSTVLIGQSRPKLRAGWNNNIRWKSLSFYGLFDWQYGDQIYNGTKQRLYQYSRSGDVDQFSKSAESKKPIDYYLRLYHSNDKIDAFVEPGSYLKFRELSVRYSPSTRTLQRLRLDRIGAERVNIGIIGRNLMTWTRYSGYDPEVGNAINRFDATTNYPNYRTFTANFEIIF